MGIPRGFPHLNRSVAQDAMRRICPAILKADRQYSVRGLGAAYCSLVLVVGASLLRCDEARAAQDMRAAPARSARRTRPPSPAPCWQPARVPFSPRRSPWQAGPRRAPFFSARVRRLDALGADEIVRAERRARAGAPAAVLIGIPIFAFAFRMAATVSAVGMPQAG